MSQPRAVSTAGAPAAIGPYSQAVVHGGCAWCSGQIALDPDTGAMVEGGAGAQARQVLANLDAVLRAAGTGLHRVLKVTVYLVDLDDFAAVNRAYAQAFGEARPARATVQVAALPKGALVEIDCVAALPGD